MAENLFKLDIFSPEKSVFSGEVVSVVAVGTDGSFGVLANHAPLLTSLEIGVLKITDNSNNKPLMLALNGGFLEVVNNSVTVLAETAELPEDIDVARAKAAKERAESRLSQKGSDIDLRRAEVSLKKAISRLEVKGEI